ncbi:hypothetical protein ACEPAI_8099 [Sanghuangporus weigelae]
MRPTQRPTATGMRVRSTRDANVLFHAVTCGILPMVTRRLDAADRATLRPGCVYVWEERSPASDATGAGMERFTEGRHWHPSRVRDDFLLYIEKDWDTNETHTSERNRMLRHNRESYSSNSYTTQPVKRQPLVKQTYSAWVNTGTSLKKWHMNAYYTEDTLEHLRIVDDVPILANLHVPHECYQRARSSTVGSNKKAERGPREALPTDVSMSFAPRRNSISAASQSSQSDRDQSLSQGFSPFIVQARYSPFPPSPVSAIASSSQLCVRTRTPILSECAPLSDGQRQPRPVLVAASQRPAYEDHHRNKTHFASPSPAPSATSSHLSSLPSPAASDNAGPSPLLLTPATPVLPSGSCDPRSLVPLEHLRAGQLAHRREPADDEILRSFRLL